MLTTMRLGEVIKRWRKMSDINIRDAARSMKIAPATLSRIENGKDADSKTLAAILTWLMGEPNA
jgi:transcriptional regulator with XRE-family HTH domain